MKVLAATNSVTFLAMLFGFLSPLGREDWFTWFFVAGVLLHAVTFLAFYRHLRNNVSLTAERRNRWEIILFVAQPFSFLVYSLRHMNR